MKIERDDAAAELDLILDSHKYGEPFERLITDFLDMVVGPNVYWLRHKDRRIDVLDKGYVILRNYYVDGDLNVVNAGRASYQKRTTEMRPADYGLLAFLGTNGHTSPFRHAFATFEISAPLEVARQWWKYVVGSDHTMSGWNESSRRYVTLEPEFTTPSPGEWRGAPDNKKQGSKGLLPEDAGRALTEQLAEHQQRGKELYEQAMASGVAPEQARLFLAAYGMYTTWVWSGSVQSIAHFLNQRLDEHAQAEIREYAQAVYELIVPCFPSAIRSLLTDDLESQL